MKLRFDHLPYRRKFRQPLATAHGEWRYRDGIIVRLQDADGRIGFGEIAPVPGFGTETLAEALAWCAQEPTEFRERSIPPNNLPCCGFALWSAKAQIAEEPQARSFSVAALVQTPEELKEKQSAGSSTFKLKIGVRGFEKETPTVEACLSMLRSGEQLRLDANGGLSEPEFSAWLELLEGQPIEFLEQPLAVGFENRILEMVEPFSTLIALDESVAGGDSITQWSTWPGPMVIKPSLLGAPPKKLPRFALGSSVFETSFGMEAALQYLCRHQKADQAIGFDTASLLESDGWDLHEASTRIVAGALAVGQLQALWEEKK